MRLRQQEMPRLYRAQGGSAETETAPREEGEKKEKEGKEGKEGEEGLRVLLDHGDMLIYRGEYEHWREPFEGENCGQVYLHYNDTSKEEAEENKYDERPFLGLPPWFKGYEL